MKRSDDALPGAPFVPADKTAEARGNVVLAKPSRLGSRTTFGVAAIAAQSLGNTVAHTSRVALSVATNRGHRARRKAEGLAGSSAAHSALVHAILGELGSLPGVVLGANASGRARYVSERTGKAAVVPYGWLSPGGPDLLAVVAPLGRLVALEVKTGGARLTKAQNACHAALRAVGVAVHVVRSVAEARAALEQAR